MNPLDGANTINLEAMILPDNVLHAGDDRAQAALAEARRDILRRIFSGQIRFLLVAGRKFKLEPWG